MASARLYTDWLVSAGVERGLIGPREPDRIWSRHVLNCAVLSSVVPADATVVDVGSGAGLPGIPLAIARPDVRVTLVEPLERRTAFLDEVVAALELTNVRVLRGRADEVVDRCGGADVVTSRAVAPLARLMTWSAPLARIGGEILAMKGSSAAEEIERDRQAVANLGVGELSVLTVGDGVVDPPTYVIRGLVRSSGRAGRKGGKPTAKQRRTAR
ncbi:16S rRNA (guanine(527)-N(7))-methyltransferase RsmG [Nakamurella deserti]|uniref:16S rRNA (guanine(527)-N(7))-methyltransferase RsmG n=1 Tax=Nakamurella deserti TaxID=2164074 RepID=UPI00197C48EF|nr:16S rRNA (guanine(527)-N(7))-methyltransferase RsmG [Nakamurella deserti]